MAKHYNPSIAENAARILNTKNGEHVNSEITPFLQPVIPINSVCNIVRSVTTTAFATIFTTPSDKDFYLTSATMSIQKAADSDVTLLHFQVTIGGVALNVMTQAFLTLTAAQETVTLALVPPIKIDRNTTIVVGNNSSAGTNLTSGNLTGYTVETTK